jgi:cell division GTPase FtsZ
MCYGCCCGILTRQCDAWYYNCYCNVQAFQLADDVLLAGVRSVTDLMVMPGLINLDFSDVQAVMADMGNAMMGKLHSA